MEMDINVVKCDAGHFYDSNKYSECPICAKKSGRPITESSTSIDMQPAEATVSQPTEITCESPKDDFKIPVSDQKAKGSTNGMFNNHNKGTAQVTDNSSADDDLFAKDIVYDDKKTMGAFMRKSTKANDNEVVTNPAVGWLVCVEGKNFGKTFEIVAGNSSIGRDGTNQIVLANDDSVSRQKHAFIIFDPKKCKFFVKPGEGSQLTYLNEENIMEAKPLKQYDLLEIGTGKYVFVPLCCAKFSWETYISED